MLDDNSDQQVPMPGVRVSIDWYDRPEPKRDRCEMCGTENLSYPDKLCYSCSESRGGSYPATSPRNDELVQPSTADADECHNDAYPAKEPS